MGLAQPSVETDRAALEAIYHATGGEHWTDSTNWLSDAPLGEWHGVSTDAAGRVTELDLIENGLKGTIPEAIGGLASLETLYLGWNGLTGTIPDWLGGLAGLKRLDLSANRLKGPIPDEIGDLADLKALYLSDNLLTGSIPEAIGELANLEDLRLSDNLLTGSIPEAIGNLASLQVLFISHTDLTGPIPDALGSLINLKTLYLSSNHLTGTIPATLGSLVNLSWLAVHGNALTGPIPDFLGRMTSLEALSLGANGFSGPVPDTLGDLSNLFELELTSSWGLSGALPDSLRLPSLRYLSLWGSKVCVPASWKDWLETVHYYDDGARLCGAEPDETTMDIAVFYTPAAREAAGGVAAIEAFIDLKIAETNQAYAASAVIHRLALVARSEVPYTEADPHLDLYRLKNSSDGYMDEVHAIRDRTGADLVHLLVYHGALAYVADPFSLTCLHCDTSFTHEVGHSLGLIHDRYQTRVVKFGGQGLAPYFGYVNQRAFDTDAPVVNPWTTIMAYGTQCADADVTFTCPRLLRFSNPRQTLRGDPLGVPFGSGGSGISGAADAAGYINETGFLVAAWRDRPAVSNQPPVVVGTLQDLRLAPGDTLTFDVAGAFVDPEEDTLRYGVSSSAPDVAAVLADGTRVALTALAAGTSTVRVVATDPGGLSVSQSFTVTVDPPANRPPEPVGVLGPLTIALDDPPADVDLAGAFRDLDGDPLTYRAVSSAPAVAAVVAAGARLTVTALAEGTTAVTVTATDPDGLSATQSFTVTVRPPVNRAPVAVGVLGSLTIALDDPAAAVDVTGAFRDPDGDELTYRAVSSAPAVAAVVAAGARLTVTALAEGTTAVTVTATDPDGLSASQSFTVTVDPPANRPPEPVGVLEPLTIGLDDPAASVDVRRAFRDADGDVLTYGAVSSSPAVASVSVSGSVVAVTPAGTGTAVVTVTATDATGSNTAATRTFTVRVVRPFTDHPIVPRVTPVRAVHFTELRTRIDGLRAEAGLPRFAWTDPTLTAGVTAVRLVHLLELREALAAAYLAAGRSAPVWTDAAPSAGETPIRAAHLMDLRAAVRALE